MASITIKFNVDNAAYRNLDKDYNNDETLNYGAVADTLKDISSKVDQGYDSGIIADTDGNIVGNWSFS